MAKLAINSKMIIFGASGVRSIPGVQRPNGTFVGDVIAPGVTLESITEIDNIMKIGGLVQQLISGGQFNFSRKRDMYSVDIYEAFNSAVPVIAVIEFAVFTFDDTSTATLTVAADKIEKYISHSKKDPGGGSSGMFERIAMRFNPDGGAKLQFGHKLSIATQMIMMKMGKEMALRQAEIGVAKALVNGIASNVRAFL